MSCQRQHCGMSISVTVAQFVINQATCNYRDIYDTCPGVIGEYSLAGCISQAPSYDDYVPEDPVAETECSQLVGEYPLTGCISYVYGSGGSGGGGGAGPIGGQDIGDGNGDIG